MSGELKSRRRHRGGRGRGRRHRGGSHRSGKKHVEQAAGAEGSSAAPALESNGSAGETRWAEPGNGGGAAEAAAPGWQPAFGSEAPAWEPAPAGAEMTGGEPAPSPGEPQKSSPGETRPRRGERRRRGGRGRGGVRRRGGRDHNRHMAAAAATSELAEAHAPSVVTDASSNGSALLEGAAALNGSAEPAPAMPG